MHVKIMKRTNNTIIQAITTELHVPAVTVLALIDDQQ